MRNIEKNSLQRLPFQFLRDETKIIVTGENEMNRKQTNVVWAVLLAVCVAWAIYAIRYDLFGTWKFWGLQEPDSFISGLDALLSLSLLRVVKTFVFHFMAYIIPVILIGAILIYRLKDKRAQ